MARCSHSMMIKSPPMRLEEYQLQNWNGRDISASVAFDDLSILLLTLFKEPMLERRGHRNLVAINSNGQIVWVADLPGIGSSYSFFNEIQMREGKLWAWAGSALCIVDPGNGNILEEHFVK